MRGVFAWPIILGLIAYGALRDNANKDADFDWFLKPLRAADARIFGDTRKPQTGQEQKQVTR